jgi:hypothetical protein
MSLTIVWKPNATTRCRAVFAKTVVGVRVAVFTYCDSRAIKADMSDQVWDRMEIGNLDAVLAAMVNPRGVYRVAPLMELTFCENVRSFVEEMELEEGFDFYADPVSKVETFTTPQAPLGSNLHPVFQRALSPFLNRGSHDH